MGTYSRLRNIEKEMKVIKQMAQTPKTPNTVAIESRLATLETKFEQIAADSVVTPDEVTEYKDSSVAVYREIMITHAKALDDQRAYYEEQLEKHKRNFAYMVLGVQTACLGILVTVLQANSFDMEAIWSAISTFCFSILISVITLFNKGYLKGVGWTYLANILNPFLEKARKRVPAGVQATVAGVIGSLPDAPKLESPPVIAPAPAPVAAPTVISKPAEATKTP